MGIKTFSSLPDDNLVLDSRFVYVGDCASSCDKSRFAVDSGLLLTIIDRKRHNPLPRFVDTVLVLNNKKPMMYAHFMYDGGDYYCVLKQIGSRQIYRVKKEFIGEYGIDMLSVNSYRYAFVKLADGGSIIAVVDCDDRYHELWHRKQDGAEEQLEFAGGTEEDARECIKAFFAN